MKTFQEFWPFYLGEHSNRTNRLLHFMGSTLSLCILISGVLRGDWRAFPVALLCGYGFAWVGHFVIEKNRPATFKYPFWSFAGDWKMWALMLTGRLEKERQRLGQTT